MWLDNLLAKGVARDPKTRFETAEEFILALERGDARALSAPRATPIAQRDPAAFWRAIAIASLIANLLALYLLLAK